MIDQLITWQVAYRVSCTDDGQQCMSRLPLFFFSLSLSLLLRAGDFPRAGNIRCIERAPRTWGSVNRHISLFVYRVDYAHLSIYTRVCFFSMDVYRVQKKKKERGQRCVRVLRCVSLPCFNVEMAGVASHRIASHRIASHRVASAPSTHPLTAPLSHMLGDEDCADAYCHPR